MRKDDREIKKILQSNCVKMDDGQKRKVDILLANLPEKDISIEKEAGFKETLRWGGAWKPALATLAVLLALPNVNPVVAHAMYEIPLVGKFFEVVTIRNYEYQDATHEADIKVPEVVAEDGMAEAVNELNIDSSTFVDQIICEFEENFSEGSHQATYVDYEVICDTEDWFTLRILVSEVEASSDEYYKYYHIDKTTGELVELGDLFVDDKCLDAISENIREQMKAQMEADEEEMTFYWIESEFEEERDCYKIAADQNFYFNEAGEIVIVYNKYDVAPGYMGCPEFAVPQEVYREYLK